MIKESILLCVAIISCSMQPSLNLRSKLAIGKISFKDSSEVYINKLPLGILTVNDVNSERFEVQLFFKKYINIPNNSVLVYFDNPVGNSFFEIKMGNSKSNFKNNELIIFNDHYFEKSLKDSTVPKKLTKPKMVVDNK